MPRNDGETKLPPVARQRLLTALADTGAVLLQARQHDHVAVIHLGAAKARDVAGAGVMALLLPIAAAVGALLFVGWILATFSLLTQHSIFGWYLPHGIPLWVGLVALAAIYFIVSAPLKFVRHRSNGYHAGWGALHGLIWLAGTVLLLWGAYHLFPGVREVLDQLMWAANLTVNNISETIA